MKRPIHILVIEGRFYDDVSDELLRGAGAALANAGAAWQLITVPGALEIPQVLAAAISNQLFRSQGNAGPFDGCVALGCVIRGETSHYDIVANESARALLQLATTHNIPLGNGILTVENHAQAVARAKPEGKNKGAAAVKACLDLIEIRRKLIRQGKQWRRSNGVAAAMRKRCKS